MKRPSFSLAFLACIVFIFAGCGTPAQDSMSSDSTQKDNPTFMTKDAMPEEKMQEEQMPEEKTSDTSSAHVQTQIKFSGKAMGQHKAEFTWEIPEDMAAQAEKYVVIRSTDPEPTYPASWWWWRGPAHHDLTWEDLPEGKAYFRLCVLKGETCLEYSNPLELTIQ